MPAVQATIGEANHMRAAAFARLWQHVHANPEGCPIPGSRREHLVCRLRPVAPEQRAWIEAERLADHPQIVPHILALPRSRPVVAEVLFPATFTIQLAKRFILQELQELAVHAGAQHALARGHSNRLVLQLANRSAHGAAVDLAKGVQEHLNPRSRSGPVLKPA